MIEAVVHKEARGVAPWSGEHELKGFQEFCKGAFAAFRNPLSHHELPLDSTDTFSCIAVAHLILQFLEAPADES